MTTIGTLLSGGEGVGCGAREAGITHLWGFEYDDAVAQVARNNGFNVTTADVMTLDPTTLQIPDILHASPVCKRASVANQGAELNEDGTKEALEDIAMGQKIAQFIDVMKPRYFTCENVYAYRHFKAFKAICAALTRNGYVWDYDNLNAADFGVPQSRRRLVLRAVRGGLLPRLTPTHHNPADYNPDQMAMFAPATKPWVGWYESILDLIPGLPDSRFADWQLGRLPEEIKGNLMTVINGEASDYILAAEPAQTIASNHSSNKYRAFIVDGDGNRSRQPTILADSEPSMTILAWHGRRPIQTPKAFLVNTRELHGNEKGSLYTAVQAAAPSYTVASTSAPSRHRAWLSQGRVVSMTVEALARFQAFPRWYKFSGNKKLDCTIVGNAVSPLLYQRVIEAFG